MYSMVVPICMGTLKPVKDSNLINGYSKGHLKKFFGKADYVYIKGTAESFDELVIAHTEGTSISGVQRKMFMHLEDGVLMPSNNGEYIVKPTPKKFPSLSENEHAMMKLSEAVGLKTAQCSVIPFEDGELAYITKRFDLIPNANKRYFIEDGASICNVSPKHKDSDSLSYENTLKQMVNSCAGAQATALVALRMLILGYIVGNNDMHLKNFSLYRKPTSKTATFDGFTPIYDMLSVAPYTSYFGEDLSLCMFETESSEALFSNSYEIYGHYTFENFYLLAQSLGIAAKAAQILINNFVDSIEKKAEPILSNSNLPDNLKSVILGHVTNKCYAMRQETIA